MHPSDLAAIALKTVYGGIVYARAADLDTGRQMIRLTDKAGAYRAGPNATYVWAAVGNLLVDERRGRRVRALFETFPNGERHRSYAYAETETESEAA